MHKSPQDSFQPYAFVMVEIGIFDGDRSIYREFRHLIERSNLSPFRIKSGDLFTVYIVYFCQFTRLILRKVNGEFDDIYEN